MQHGMKAAVDAPTSMRVCVGIATKGRPDQLASMLDHLANQTLQPDRIIVCCTESIDIGSVAERSDVTVLYAEAGSSRQRNTILSALPEGTDWVAFFDDDFYPERHWLENVDRAFQTDSTVASITGFLVLDGIMGPGLSEREALSSLAMHDAATTDWSIDGFGPYGCNMAFRCSAIKDLRFDENLVLYGWLEDLDFGAVIAQTGGRLIKLGTAIGVHLGTKRGRVSGRKFGYSQVMNPIYLHRKGTMSLRQVVRQISRNVTANVAKSLKPEPYVDRRGRLVGNLIAALDLMRLRVTPQRAASL